MVKSLKIIPEWETCSSIEAVKNKAARFLLQNVVSCYKSKIAVLRIAFRGNDFEASFLNGAEHDHPRLL